MTSRSETGHALALVEPQADAPIQAIPAEEMLRRACERVADAAHHVERAAAGARDLALHMGRSEEARAVLTAARLLRLARFLLNPKDEELAARRLHRAESHGPKGKGDVPDSTPAALGADGIDPKEMSRARLDEIDRFACARLRGRDLEEHFRSNAATREALFPALEQIVVRGDGDSITRAVRLLDWICFKRERLPAIRERISVEWRCTEEEARAGRHAIARALATAIDRCDRDRANDGSIATAKIATRVLRALGMPENVRREIANRD